MNDYLVVQVTRWPDGRLLIRDERRTVETVAEMPLVARALGPENPVGYYRALKFRDGLILETKLDPDWVVW